MKKDVFISYSSKESSIAYTVKGVLEENGISCWMAPESIAPGANYMQEIPEGIENCKVFLILLSQAAQESTWVQNELSQAASYGKTIIPFMIQKCDINKAFSFALSNSQRMDAYENMSKKLKELVIRIKGILSVESKASAEDFSGMNASPTEVTREDRDADKYDADIMNKYSKKKFGGTASQNGTEKPLSGGQAASAGTPASGGQATSAGTPSSGGRATSAGAPASGGRAASAGAPSSDGRAATSALPASAGTFEMKETTKLPFFGGKRNIIVFVIAIFVSFFPATVLAYMLTTDEYANYCNVTAYDANFLALCLGLIATITALFGRLYRTRLAKWCYWMNAIAMGVMYTEFCRIMEGFNVWAYLLISVVWVFVGLCLIGHFDGLKKTKAYANYMSNTFFGVGCYPIGFIIYVIFAKLFRFSESFWLTTTSVLMFLVIIFFTWVNLDYEVK